jgi:hypothetical protein
MKYEVWALEQLTQKVRCRVEKSMSCIPLRNDPICQACYESDKELEEKSLEEHDVKQKA